MPAKLFTSISDDYDFDPTLLRFLAEEFESSITYRYFECGHHPICLVYSYNNKVRYWKRHDNFGHFLKGRKELPPPEDSIAAEFFNAGKIYPKSESMQEVDKSTWFELRDRDRDQDFTFYEYCIVTPNFSPTPWILATSSPPSLKLICDQEVPVKINVFILCLSIANLIY